MVLGNINSIETFGTLDGPGIRYILFLQGCLLQCKYCHNRNTWEKENYNFQKTPKEILEDFLKYKNFYKNGGITVSGGEPLLQTRFCLELFKLMKQNNNVHTCIDTSGIILNSYVKELLNFTDLVLLDIKSINEKIHKELTGQDLNKVLNFLAWTKEINKKIWIRHVIIPGITDNIDILKQLAIFLGSYNNIERIDLLPYHTMGLLKWEQMGLKSPISDIPPLEKTKFLEIKKELQKYNNKII